MGTGREQVEDFKDALSHDAIFDRLKLITEELILLHRKVSFLLSAELRGKAETFLNVHENSVTVRDRYASYSQIDVTSDIIQAKGSIAAYEEERDFLRLCLEHRLNTSHQFVNG